MLFGGIQLGRVGFGVATHAIDWRRGEAYARCNLWGRPAWPLETPEGWPIFGPLADVTCRRCVARLTGATTPAQVDLAIRLANFVKRTA